MTPPKNLHCDDIQYGKDRMHFGCVLSFLGSPGGRAESACQKSPFGLFGKLKQPPVILNTQNDATPKSLDSQAFFAAAIQFEVGLNPLELPPRYSNIFLAKHSFLTVSLGSPGGRAESLSLHSAILINAFAKSYCVADGRVMTLPYDRSVVDFSCGVTGSGLLKCALAECAEMC